MVQFSFNSFCSLYNEKYRHRIVRFIHHFFLTGNPILDFSYMPLPLLDKYFSSNSSFRSLFSSILDMTIINGIQCSNSNMPNFLTECAEFFQNNTTVSILSLPNCNLKTGAKDLAYSIQANSKIELKYIDLSQNNIEDIDEFAKSIQYLKSPLFYLNLNDNFLDLEATTSLFKGIIESENLHSLTHILVNKSTIDDQILIDFSMHITNLALQNKNILKYLDLGSIGKGSDLLFQSLADNQVPIECLKIAGSKFDQDSIDYFNIFLSNAPFLQELDISNTDLNMDEIGNVINSIQSNKKITEITLHINSMKLHGKRLLEFIKKFRDHALSKWVGLGLEGNNIDQNDLQELNKLFQTMINLSWLNLSCNFTPSMKKLSTELSKLLSIPRLNFIELRGNMKKNFKGKKVKGNEIRGTKIINNRALLSFISSLKKITHKIGLDLRFNAIKDKTIVKLGEAAANGKISDLLLDCDDITNIDSLISLCNSISQSNSIISFNFPLHDLHSLLKPYKSRLTTKNRNNMYSDAYLLDNARIKALLNVMKNQTSFGYHSSLSFQHVSKLEKLIDESILNMNNYLKNKRPFKHSIFSETIRLPLPFQTGKKKASSATKIQNYKRIYSNGPGSYYYVPKLFIQEKGTSESIQFNSLCLRRPGASTSFQIPDSINAMITDSLMSSLNSNRYLSSLTQSNSKGLPKIIKNHQSHTLVNDINPYNSINNGIRVRNIDSNNQLNSISKPLINKNSNSGVPDCSLKLYEEREIRLTSESNTGSLVRIKSDIYITSSSIKEKKKSSDSEKRIKSWKNLSSGNEKKINSRNHSSESDEYEYYEYIIEEEEDGIEYLYDDEDEEKYHDTTNKKFMNLYYNESETFERSNSSDNFIDLNKNRAKKRNKYFESSDKSDDYIDTKKKNSYKKNSNIERKSDTDNAFSNKKGKATLRRNYENEYIESESDFIDTRRKNSNLGRNGKSDTDNAFSNKKGKSDTRKNNKTDNSESESDFIDTRRKNFTRKNSNFGRNGKSDTDNILSNKKGKTVTRRNHSSESSESESDFIDTRRKNSNLGRNGKSDTDNAFSNKKGKSDTRKNNKTDNSESESDFIDTRRKNFTRKNNNFGRNGKSDTDNAFSNKKGKSDTRKNNKTDNSESESDFIDTRRKNFTRKNSNLGRNGRSDTDNTSFNRKGKTVTRRNHSSESSESESDFIDTRRKNSNRKRYGKSDTDNEFSYKKGKNDTRKNNYFESSDTDDFIDRRKKNIYKKK